MPVYSSHYVVLRGWAVNRHERCYVGHGLFLSSYFAAQLGNTVQRLLTDTSCRQTLHICGQIVMVPAMTSVSGHLSYANTFSGPEGVP